MLSVCNCNAAVSDVYERDLFHCDALMNERGHLCFFMPQCGLVTLPFQRQEVELNMFIGDK